MNFAGIASSSLEVHPLTITTEKSLISGSSSSLSVRLTPVPKAVSSSLEQQPPEPGAGAEGIEKTVQVSSSLGSDRLISQIEPIRGIHRIITEKNQLEKVVEEPLLEAIENLYDKGIRTIMSSANQEDLKFSADGKSYGYIIVDYDTLSEENKKIADGLIQEGYEDVKIDKYIHIWSNRRKEGQPIRILIPLTAQSTVREISQKAVKIASIFKAQKMLWVPTTTLEELRKLYHLPEGTIEDFLEITGGYYDKKSKLFYLSKEHADKARKEPATLCLTPDSLITLADGSTKPLIELKPLLTYAVNKGTNLGGSEGGSQGGVPGDMVLSLNEETGRLEPHRVLALLDMGVKPVYRITTQSGKSLKTTLTHPYLTRDGWKKLSEIKVGEDVAVAKQRYSEINERVLSLPADAQNRLLLRSQQELSKHRLAFPLFITSFFGIDKYTSKNEYYAQDSNANSPEKREFLEEIARQPNDKNSLSQVSDCFGNKFYFIFRKFFHPEKIYHGLIKLSRHFLPQDAFAQPTNPDILWDKVVSIEYLGNQQVYDIEVEATHNFIAQGIVAHNTYAAGSPLEEKNGASSEKLSPDLGGHIVGNIYWAGKFFFMLDSLLGIIWDHVTNKKAYSDVIEIYKAWKEIGSMGGHTISENPTAPRLKFQKDATEIIISLGKTLESHLEQEKDTQAQDFFNWVEKNNDLVKEQLLLFYQKGRIVIELTDKQDLQNPIKRDRLRYVLVHEILHQYLNELPLEVKKKLKEGSKGLVEEMQLLNPHRGWNWNELILQFLYSDGSFKLAPNGKLYASEKVEQEVIIRRDPIRRSMMSFYEKANLAAVEKANKALLVWIFKEQDIKLEDFFNKEYGIYIVPEDREGLLRKMGAKADRDVFILEGNIFILQTILEKIKSGDKEALLFIKYQQGLNKYDLSHPHQHDVQQRLVREIYAYFSSLVDTYGSVNSDDFLEKFIYMQGKGFFTYAPYVNDYISGADSLEAKQGRLEQIRFAVRALLFWLKETGSKFKPEITFEYLRTIKTLEQVVVILPEGWYEKLGHKVGDNHEILHKQFRDYLVSKLPEKGVGSSPIHPEMPITDNRRDNIKYSRDTTGPGGIDLNPQNLNLKVLEQGQGVSSPFFHPQALPSLSFDPQDFQGFSFQILKMERLRDLQEFASIK